MIIELLRHFLYAPRTGLRAFLKLCLTDRYTLSFPTSAPTSTATTNLSTHRACQLFLQIDWRGARSSLRHCARNIRDQLCRTKGFERTLFSSGRRRVAVSGIALGGGGGVDETKVERRTIASASKDHHLFPLDLSPASAQAPRWRKWKSRVKVPFIGMSSRVT